MISIKKQNKILWIISSLLLFPLFLQLSGGIYNSFTPIVDSGGVLLKLPLPISILACMGGILMLLGNYRRGYLALATIVAMFLFMLMSIIFAGLGMDIGKSKGILLLQVMLPIFGLLLGQMVVDPDKVIAKAFLYVLLLVVPVQLVATFLAGSLTLTHNLFVFSIYQHFQYVPLIFVSAYAFVMVNLWESHKHILCTFTPIVFVYAIASISFLTIFAFMAFIAVFAYTKLALRMNKILAVIVIAASVTVLVFSMQAYFKIAKDNTNIGKMKNSSTVLNADGGQYAGKVQALSSGKTPANVSERFEIWKLYIPRITESGNALIFGHDAPLPREVRTSAHNWYIDMIYNFGLLSILPISLLMFYTAFLCWKFRASLSSETIWLMAIVFYLVVIDNNFKVTFRQPYPGIFSFFLWGLLLTKLQLFVTKYNQMNASSKPGYFNWL